MASKSQKSMSQHSSDDPSPKQHSAPASTANAKGKELLPSDRNEKSDISSKIAFLAYN
ncbi:MAG: hypothetical protein ACI8P9_001962 [Parasphingorhabdus sp.]|jgi:hypothetical protein